MDAQHMLWFKLFNIFRRSNLSKPLSLALEQHKETLLLCQDRRTLVQMMQVTPFLLIALNLDDEAVSFIQHCEDGAKRDDLDFENVLGRVSHLV